MTEHSFLITLGVGLSTRDSASLVPGRNSDPSGEISLSYMDTHDGLLHVYSNLGGNTALSNKPDKKKRIQKVYYIFQS